MKHLWLTAFIENRYKSFLLVSILIITGLEALVSSQKVLALSETSDVCTLGISEVNVIPMDNEQVLKSQSVLINQRKIIKIGASSLVTTKGCQTVIKGKGRYLMPGLNDMHTHLETTGFDQAFNQQGPDINFDHVLAPYLAHGITGLRILSGGYDQLEARNNIKNSNAALPRLVVSSPMLTGHSFLIPEPLTAITADKETARATVRMFAGDGFDLIKIRSNLPKEVYDAVIDEATKLGLDVDGHLSRNNGRDFFETLQSGQKGFAHSDEIARAAARSPEGTDKAIKLLLACNCYVSTSIAIFNNIHDFLDDFDGVTASTEMRYVHPQWKLGFWSKTINPYLKEHPPKDFFLEVAGESRAFIKQFYDAGGMVLAGSDSLNPMMPPGIGLQKELTELTNAGLSPYQALSTATLYPSKAISQFADVGQVKEDFTANLLLLESNPLDDISAINKPDIVIINGRVLVRKILEEKLEQAALHFEEMRKFYPND